MQKEFGRNMLELSCDSTGITLTVGVVSLGVSTFFLGDSLGSFVTFFLGDCIGLASVKGFSVDFSGSLTGFFAGIFVVTFLG